jgi:ABC-type nitrate/sulfonate/bicarbonate transport system substrate-binding protein
VGFVPLTDCAPLIMAHELGLFRKYGLRVALSRELGWATIRDKIIHRELDAAHALASMPVAATLGLGSIRCDCLTGLVLNLHGNAITLSEELWRRGVRDGATLRDEIRKLHVQKKFTFGVVNPFSSHHYLLRNWLASFGIRPDRDVRIVTVPPPQMVPNLKAGNLDGFCRGPCRGARSAACGRPGGLQVLRRSRKSSTAPCHAGAPRLRGCGGNSVAAGD